MLLDVQLASWGSNIKLADDSFSLRSSFFFSAIHKHPSYCYLMCFIILLMQFNQNTVTRYEYTISLLLSALLSFPSHSRIIFFAGANVMWDEMARETTTTTKEKGKKSEPSQHHRCCINMNGARSMQKMKISVLFWYEIVYGDWGPGDNKRLVLHG